ncbi:MAG TPA: hypothetical protein PK876_03615 [Elusimicrobiota bacterium]|nr:hypothetical protein [Elusimicrobiota bacterium]
MSQQILQEIFETRRKDIVTGMTFAIKDLRGSYERRPVEEIYKHCEEYYEAHVKNILEGRFQLLLDFADQLARKRAAEGFRLHELIRGSLMFKKVVYPILVEKSWDNKSQLVEHLLAVDRSVDRFIVNMAQVFVHYSREHILKDPLEFPVWLEDLQRRYKGESFIK